MSNVLDLQKSDGTGATGNGTGVNLTERVRSLRLPAHASVGRPARPWLPWLLVVLLAGTTAYFGVQALNPPDNSAGDKSVEKGSDAKSAASTRANIASSGEVVVESKGYIIPAHQIQVSPKVSGAVLKLFVEEGKRVKKGDVLAELEKIDYQADRDHAKANLELAKQKLLELEHGNRKEEIEGAKAELDEAEANREQLYKDWKRDSQLAATGSAVAPKELELAHGLYKAMDRRVEKLKQNYRLMVLGARQERIDQARAEVGQAEAELAKAEWRLDNCTVRAPISGTILTKYAEEGNIVNQLSFNLKGSLCDMADLSDLEIEMKIQEREVAKVFKGQKCKIRSDAYPDRVYEGYVSRLMPIADRGKGAIEVRVKINVPKEEEGVYLKPEMGSNVSFLK